MRTDVYKARCKQKTKDIALERNYVDYLVEQDNNNI